MTPLSLADIRATIIDGTPDMMAALLRDLDWMIDAGLDVAPATDDGHVMVDKSALAGALIVLPPPANFAAYVDAVFDRLRRSKP